MITSISSSALVNPTTQDQAIASFNIKMWTQYLRNTVTKRRFHLNNKEECEEAFNDMTAFVAASINDKRYKTFDAAGLFLIDALGIGDGESLAKAFARDLWGDLHHAGFWLPFIYTHVNGNPTTVQSNIIQKVVPQVEKRPVHRVVNIHTPSTPVVNDTLEGTIKRTRPCTKGKVDATHDHTKKYAYTNIPEGVLLPDNYATLNPDQYVILWDSNVKCPRMLYKMDESHYGKKISDMEHDGYIYAVKDVYVKQTGCTRYNVKAITLSAYLTGMGNYCRGRYASVKK